MRRRTLLTAAVAGAALAAAGAAPARAYGGASGPRPLHVHPGESVQAAVDAVTGPGWTIVVHPGTYRETVTVQASAAGLTLVGASADPRDAVIVYDNANGMHTRATYLGDWTPYAPQHE